MNLNPRQTLDRLIADQADGQPGGFNPVGLRPLPPENDRTSICCHIYILPLRWRRALHPRCARPDDGRKLGDGEESL